MRMRYAPSKIHCVSLYVCACAMLTRTSSDASRMRSGEGIKGDARQSKLHGRRGARLGEDVYLYLSRSDVDSQRTAHEHGHVQRTRQSEVLPRTRYALYSSCCGVWTTCRYLLLPPDPATYPELWQWSTDHYDLFWEQLFLHTNIISSKPYDEVYIHPPHLPTHPPPPTSHLRWWI